MFNFVVFHPLNVLCFGPSSSALLACVTFIIAQRGIVRLPIRERYLSARAFTYYNVWGARFTSYNFGAHRQEDNNIVVYLFTRQDTIYRGISDTRHHQKLMHTINISNWQSFLLNCWAIRGIGTARDYIVKDQRRLR